LLTPFRTGHVCRSGLAAWGRRSPVPGGGVAPLTSPGSRPWAGDKLEVARPRRPGGYQHERSAG